MEINFKQVEKYNREVVEAKEYNLIIGTMKRCQEEAADYQEKVMLGEIRLLLILHGKFIKQTSSKIPCFQGCHQEAQQGI